MSKLLRRDTKKEDNSYHISQLSGGSLIGEFPTNNLRIGTDALGSNTTGTNNMAIGYQAMKDNTTAGSNTAIGYKALEKQTVFGNNPYGGNIAIGYTSLQENTTGYFNIGIGFAALNANTTGQYNTAIGFEALGIATPISSNIGIGYRALYSGTPSNNVAMGNGVMDSGALVSPSYNVAIGNQALHSNLDGDYNVAIGHEAMNLFTGGRSVCIGYQAGKNGTTYVPLSIGYQAGYSNTTGYFNIAIGYQALYGNTLGLYNLAIGDYALKDQVAGGEGNVAIGTSALENNTTGDYSVGVGREVGFTNTTGTHNTYLGSYAGRSTTGSGNIYLGYDAGRNHNGSDKLFIDNSNTATPLIWGDFANNIIDINGTLKVGGEDIKAWLGIGIANKRWINASYEGQYPAPHYAYSTVAWTNVDGTDFRLAFSINLPYVIGGTHNLVLTKLKIGVLDADVNNYVDRVLGTGWTDHETQAAAFLDDGTNRTAAGEYTYDFADHTIGGVYEKIRVQVYNFVTGGTDLDSTYVQFEYYYT